jgi:SAM-dependent methyltransferase
MDAPHHIFDRKVHVARRAAAKGDAVSLLAQRVAEDLAERLAVITREFADVMLSGDLTGHCRAVLEDSKKCLNINSLPGSSEENLGLAEASCNAFVSVLELQTVNDVPGYLAQVARAMRPDGLGLFVFFGGETLHELRDSWLQAESEMTGGASPRVAPMIDLREAGGLLQRAGLALPVADADRVTLRYGNGLSLMQDIKSAGFSNCLVGRSRHVLPRGLLQRVAEHYQSRFADSDGKVRASLELCWAMAWKPHPSQPKALKPGSAQVSLTEILGRT